MISSRRTDPSAVRSMSVDASSWSSLTKTLSFSSSAETPGCTGARSEEHTSELQSLMRISYAVFCLKKKKKQKITHYQHINSSLNNIATQQILSNIQN